VYGSSSVFVFYTAVDIVYYPVCDTIFECRHVEDLLLILFHDLLILCKRHVSFTSFRSREVVSCHLFVVLEGNINFGSMETRCTGNYLLLFCYRRAILLVGETVFDLHSNGRGFFPALVFCGE